MATEELPGRAALQDALATTSTPSSPVRPTGSDVHAVEDAKYRLACVRQVRLFRPFADLEDYTVQVARSQSTARTLLSFVPPTRSESCG